VPINGAKIEYVKIWQWLIDNNRTFCCRDNKYCTNSVDLVHIQPVSVDGISRILIYYYTGSIMDGVMDVSIHTLHRIEQQTAHTRA